MNADLMQNQPAAIATLPEQPLDPASLLAASRAAQTKGDYAVGIVLARQAADLAAVAGDSGQEAAAYRLLAAQLVHHSEPEEAARACERACRLYEDIGDESELCECLIDLTLNYVWLGLHDEALDAVTRALNIAIRREDERLMFWAYNRTGVVHNTLGDPLQANEFLLAALALAEGLGVDEQFCIRNNLADNAPDAAETLRALGRVAEADAAIERNIGYAREAVVLAADGTHPYRESMSHGNLGLLLAIAGDFTGAEAHFVQSAELAEAYGFANLALATAHYRARAYVLRGDFASGIPRLISVLERATANGEKPIIAEVNLQLAQAYEKSGDPTLALVHYKAFHAAEKQFNTTVAQTRSRMLTNMFELETSKLEAKRARLEAELLRGRSAGLEAEKQQLQIQAEEATLHAYQDALTGLWNRRYLDSRLPGLFQRMKQAGTPVCLALADIDFFKSVNDRFGHPVGDQVLVRMAQLLLAGARQVDIIARYGGEEFLILFAPMGIEAAAVACERLRLAVAQHDWSQVHRDLQVTISLGLTCAAEKDFTAALLVADKLLYQAKEGGRNMVKIG
jgi:diguanylate cyclase (GGDEF)-like protein